MRVSYGLRAFGLYFVILGTLLWFTLDNAIERLNDGMRQAAESVMVDMANLIAESVQLQLDTSNTTLNTEPVARLFTGLGARQLKARIYNITKTHIDSTVTVTDHRGIVIYDSSSEHLGADHSRWNDVKLTLQGEYGARTSYIDRNRTNPDDPKAMYVAAPILSGSAVVGVVSLAKPINSLELHLLAESRQLRNYAFLLLLIALLIGYLLSLWFTYALNKIASYANAMAAGLQEAPPRFVDRRLDDLSDSIANMRQQLDGKQYVENYIHSLTHELKTPLTSIGGAVELLQEPMSQSDRETFLNNIATSNKRMSQLVERMLSLAKLESRSALLETGQFDLQLTLNRLVNERQAIAEAAGLSFSLPLQDETLCWGDEVLLEQAIGNLLDNALRFGTAGTKIVIRFVQHSEMATQSYIVEIFNRGELIPDYALGKVYDRFFSLPKSGNEATQSKSTGLGLSFVHEIMQLHGGSVSLENDKSGVLARLIWPAKPPA